MEIPTEEAQPQKPPQSWGAIAGTVIIIALLIAGGVYFLLMQEKKFSTPPIEQNLNV